MSHCRSLVKRFRKSKARLLFILLLGKLSAVKLFGGGYGHGTGMSQNGVKKMAETGRNYEEIIEHYYAGTELIFLY